MKFIRLEAEGGSIVTINVKHICYYHVQGINLKINMSDGTILYFSARTIVDLEKKIGK